MRKGTPVVATACDSQCKLFHNPSQAAAFFGGIRAYLCGLILAYWYKRNITASGIYFFKLIFYGRINIIEKFIILILSGSK